MSKKLKTTTSYIIIGIIFAVVIAGGRQFIMHIKKAENI